MKNEHAKRQVAWAGVLVALLFTAPALGQTSAGSGINSQSRIDQLVEELGRQKRQLAEQEQKLKEYKEAFERALTEQRLRPPDLEAQRGTGTKDAGAADASAEDVVKPPTRKPDNKKISSDRSTLAQAESQGAPKPPAKPPAKPAGQAPESSTRPPEIAPIVDYPGVLTPRGKVVLEPALELSHSSNNRVALIGFTIIPALTIGLIDVRSVSRDFFVASLAARYGLTNRLEIEVKVPYVYRQDSTTARPLNVESSADSVFDATGHGLGDIEAGYRYQLNRGGANTPFYVASLRVKTTTGTGPFDVTTFNPFSGAVLQSELPTGTGFYAIQPGLTALLASDPAVFFGSVNYIWNVKRTIHKLDSLGSPIGVYDPGDGVGFNFGMGLSLNERASFSVGYDHVVFFKDKQNGETVQLAQSRQLGSLLVGYSFRLAKNKNFNLSVGIGVTEETPDVSITARLPITF